MLKKSIFTVLILLPFCALAQKRFVQESSSLGIQFPFAKLNYDARFRSPKSSADVALGGSLLYSFRNNVGLGFNISAMFGRGASSFEIGQTYNIAFGSSNDYSDSRGGGDGVSRLQSYSFGNFIGYRFQPADKRFFLQIQHFPLTIATVRYPHYYKQTKEEFIGIVYNPYTPAPTMLYNGFAPSIALNIGYNLNFLKDTATTKKPSAYEALPAEKINLQHAFALGLLDASYDLRWRRPEKTDFALNLAYGYQGIFNKYAPANSYTVQALSLFREGKTSIEVGLEWRYTNSYIYYYDYNVPESSRYYNIKSTSIGIPIGFRLQPHRGFFMRLYAAPYKMIGVEKPGVLPPYYYYNYYQTELSQNVIDGINIGFGLGYTF